MIWESAVAILSTQASASLGIETIWVSMNRDRFILSLLTVHPARKLQFLPVAQMGKLTDDSTTLPTTWNCAVGGLVSAARASIGYFVSRRGVEESNVGITGKNFGGMDNSGRYEIGLAL